MERNFLRRRGIAIAMATVAAASAAAIATAAIPNAVDGQIDACYDQNRLQLIDTDKGQACPTGMTKTRWAQRGPTGPKGEKGESGAQGPTGPQGPAGRNDIHWITLRPGATDPGFSSSDSGVAIYPYAPGQKLVWDPSINIDRCAITVTAEDPTGYNATQYLTTFTRYYGYIWVQVQRLTTNSSGQLTMQPASVATNIIAAC